MNAKSSLAGDRRSVLKSLLAVPLLTSRIPLVSSREQNETPSKSLIQSVERTQVEVLNRLHSGNPQPGDLAREETALRVLYDHAEATGVNDAFDLAVRLRRRELANMKAADELRTAYTRFTDAGVNISEEEMREMLTRSVAELPKFLANFETVGGIRGFQAKTLSRIHARSVKVSRQAAYFSDPHVRIVEAYSCEETEGEAGLLAGAFGVAGALGCVACIPIAAGFAIGAALIQILCAPSSASFGE